MPRKVDFNYDTTKIDFKIGYTQHNNIAALDKEIKNMRGKRLIKNAVVHLGYVDGAFVMQFDRRDEAEAIVLKMKWNI